jgi:hypothetical protein
VWLLAASFVSVRLYRQMPHILDAVAYSFQASIFASGALWLEPIEAAVRGPFEVVWEGRRFSMYPPGAPAAYAIGKLIGLEWLVGPLACAALIGATAWTASALYGRRTGAAVLALGLISPFILFQAGSFLSHPIAGPLLALALAAFVKAERSNTTAWFTASGTLLGAAFCTREGASLLFGIPLAARLIGTGRWHALGWLLAGGAPWVLVYAGYNSALTGNPAVLPRNLFDAADRFGFGQGVGFHGRHTLAAGLANTHELLTVLQLDLTGWLPLVTLGLICVPFLFSRATSWDATASVGVMAFVVGYTAFYYHGIALGPRYYFEAVPWLLLLAGRGAQVLAHLAQSRTAAATLLVALSLNTLFFYMPAQLARRADYSALPNGREAVLAFVRVSPQGPRLTNVPTPSLVLTDDWWIFNAMLSSLNCPQLHSCPVVFALATSDADRERLFELFPDRLRLLAIDHDGRIDIEPYNPPRRT